MTLVGARLAGRFDVRARVRETPGYVELKAVDAEVGVEVALWCLEPGLHGLVARDMLVGEGERLRAVVAPGLRRMFAVGLDGEVPWVSYQLAEPGPQPRPGAVLPIEQVVAWVRAVATGLDAAHQHGFCHGRLVPADIGLVAGTLVVGGVGLWHDVEPGPAAAAWRSLEGFIAPEVRGGAPPTPAADAWSLAACTAALFLGAPDGGRDPERAVAERHPGLARALAGGLAREPERRVAVRDLALRIADAAQQPGARGTSRGTLLSATPATGIPTPIGAVPAPSGPVPRVTGPVPRVTGPVPRVQTGPVVLQAVSMRPAGERPPTGEPIEREVDDTGRRARIRPIAEVAGRSFPVKPGALGYMAPPRGAGDDDGRRRTLVIAAVAGALVIAGLAAVVVVMATGGHRARAAANHPDAAAVAVPVVLVDAAVAPVDAAPAPARACTAAMPHIGAVCFDAYESPGEGRLPDTGGTLDDARAVCAARGLRLCGAAEWRAACAGEGGAPWPYGTALERGACNVGSRGTFATAGSFPRCRSAAGGFDLAGNVAEWLADGTIIGGSASDGGDGRCDAPVRLAPPGARLADVGVRCCGDL